MTFSIILFTYYILLTLFYSVKATPTPLDNATIQIGLVADLSESVGADILFAVELAVRLANENSSLLPGSTVQLRSRDLQHSRAEALRATLALAAQADDGGVGAVRCLIGSEFSFTSTVVSLGASVLGVPQISFGATAPALSDKSAHPLFSRVVPSDEAQAQALVSIIQHFGWSRIFVLASDDDYGAGLLQAVESAAFAADVRVQISTSYSVQMSDTERDALLRPMVEASEPSGSPGVFVMIGLVEGGAEMLLRANAGGLLSERNVWLLADGLAAYDEDLIARIGAAALRGMIGVQPAAARGTVYESEFVPAFEEFLAARGEQSRAPFLYSPYAFDATRACLLAMHSLRAQNVPDAQKDGTALYESIIDVAFDGATGPVRFLAASGSRPGLYDVVNFRDASFVSVGRFVALDAVNVQLEFDADTPLLFADGSFNAPSFTTTVAPVSAPDTGSLPVVAIVLIVAALTVALAVTIFVLHRRYARRKQVRVQRLLGDARSCVWSDIEQRSALAQRRAREAKLDALQVRVAPNDALTFGLRAEDVMPVQRWVQEDIEIVNDSDRKLAYAFYVPTRDDYFTCEAVPGRGLLAPRERVVVSVRFQLHLTTTVDVLVCAHFGSAREVHGGGDAEQDASVARQHGSVAAAHWRVRARGELSDRLDPDDIDLETKPLGEGAFGAVFAGQYRGQRVAVKVLKNQNDLLEMARNEFVREIELFQRLHNPFVVSFVGASHVTGKLCICTEFMERGSVGALIYRIELPFVLKAKFLWNCAQAMNFMHNNNVLYRDLKPDNLLVVSASTSAHVNCKLADFGTSRNVDNSYDKRQYTKSLGTPLYMAPEVLNGLPYNCQVDVYSFAIMAWEIVAQTQPWTDVRLWDVPVRVSSGERPTLDPKWPRNLRSLLARCWATSPDDRLRFAAIELRTATIVEEAKRTAKQRRKMSSASASRVTHALHSTASSRRPKASETLTLSNQMREESRKRREMEVLVSAVTSAGADDLTSPRYLQRFHSGSHVETVKAMERRRKVLIQEHETANAGTAAVGGAGDSGGSGGRARRSVQAPRITRNRAPIGPSVRFDTHVEASLSPRIPQQDYLQTLQVPPPIIVASGAGARRSGSQSPQRRSAEFAPVVTLPRREVHTEHVYSHSQSYMDTDKPVTPRPSVSDSSLIGASPRRLRNRSPRYSNELLVPSAYASAHPHSLHTSRSGGRMSSMRERQRRRIAARRRAGSFHD